MKIFKITEDCVFWYVAATSEDEAAALVRAAFAEQEGEEEADTLDLKIIEVKGAYLDNTLVSGDEVLENGQVVPTRWPLSHWLHTDKAEIISFSEE